VSDKHFSSEDLARNRTWAALGYLVFFIPLIKCKKSPLGKYCANQGLLLAIVHVLVQAVFNVFGRIPLVGWIFDLIGGLAGVALLVVGLLCMVQLMSNDRICEIPYIGHLRLIRD